MVRQDPEFTRQWSGVSLARSQAKHGFAIADVDSMLDAPVLFAGSIVELAHEEPRYLLLGVTAEGRSAALVFARRGEKLRPISCRAMRKKEKEAYDAATQEDRWCTEDEVRDHSP